LRSPNAGAYDMAGKLTGAIIGVWRRVTQRRTDVRERPGELSPADGGNSPEERLKNSSVANWTTRRRVPRRQRSQAARRSRPRGGFARSAPRI
jgi:hypothetical protein